MTAEYLPVVFSDIICGRGKPGTSRLACITGQRSQVIEARCLNETNFCTKNSLFSSGVALHSSTVPFSNSVRQCQKSYVTGCRQSREYPSWMTHVYASPTTARWSIIARRYATRMSRSPSKTTTTTTTGTSSTHPCYPSD
jgi:hypothetical protein